jgi:hypothetical protein
VHTDRVLDPFLAINGIRAGDDMKQLIIARDFDTPGDGKNTLQVIGTHQPVITGNGDHCPVIQ